MTANTFSTLAVAAQPALVGKCGLCGRSGTKLPAEVSVTRGASVTRFDVCEFCERAAGRLQAAGLGSVAVDAAVVTPTAVVAPTVAPAVAPAAQAAATAVVPVAGGAAVVPVLSDAPTGAAVAIHDSVHKVQDGNGELYAPVILGLQRGDGEWDGIIEFRQVTGTRVLRTARETVRGSRAALTVWAAGLQPWYLADAFRRAVQYDKAGIT